MTADETVVRSFVGDDEQLIDTWSVSKISESLGHLPPMGGGEEVIAVTHERVLWFDSELEDVALEAIEEIDCEFVERQAAPAMVLVSGLLVILGVFASIGAFFANVGGPLVVAMPALTGVAVFLLANVVARVTGREGEARSGHRLRLWTTEETISIWGETDEVESLHEAIVGQVGLDGGVDEDDADEPVDDVPADDATDEHDGEDATARDA